MTTIDLWEVITTDIEGRAYGQTFHAEGTAHQYARLMRRHAYSAEVSPVFGTQPDLTEAIRMAAIFYENDSLTREAAYRKELGL